MQTRISKLRQQPHRRGAAAAEAAIALPVLFLMFFAQLEFSRVNTMRHSIHDAAYEGARRGLAAGASADDVQDKVEELLDAVSVSAATVTVSPAVITHSTPQVTVTISIPLNSNSWTAPVHFLDRTLTSTITLDRDVTGAY